ncbi:YhdT family protein [Actinobacillus delphinicola]|uniref:Predicted membrane protein n=1 Tax=Actinobacillus delphinicola TaxID=51161 RepID=A0A448TVK2_9PAST|nr:DUF997 family protein [Actinobacillus delphinicola]VEJ09953.1 Predicted membrane protein [Actinobacillus delphinicola]
MSVKNPLKQATKEARLAFGLTVFYLCGWCLCAYFAPQQTGLLGFPLWFELACFYLPILFIIVTAVVIHFFFKDIELNNDCTDESKESENHKCN